MVILCQTLNLEILGLKPTGTGCVLDQSANYPYHRESVSSSGSISSSLKMLTEMLNYKAKKQIPVQVMNRVLYEWSFHMKSIKAAFDDTHMIHI